MSSKRTLMVALGGNALAPKNEAGTITQQFARTRESLDGIMRFVNLDYLICITHGNGPQAGTAPAAGCMCRWYSGYYRVYDPAITAE